mgnify:CR=1 FL=1
MRDSEQACHRFLLTKFLYVIFWIDTLGNFVETYGSLKEHLMNNDATIDDNPRSPPVPQRGLLDLQQAGT